jgi:tetratricopeptide (TPR) repeat protein
VTAAEDTTAAPDSDARAKKVIAVMVVAVTFLGAWVAYLSSGVGAQGAVVVRDAEQASIVAMSERAAASARFTGALAAYNETQNARLRSTLADTEHVTLREAAAEREARAWAEAEHRLDSVSPLLADDRYRPDIDGQFAFDYWLDELEPATAATLREAALQETADDLGAKAARYTTILTFLAVALALLGLSLALSGRLRLYLIAPALLIVAGCVVALVGVITGAVRHTPQEAVAAAAKGQTLISTKDPQGALASFEAALSERSDYPEALLGRALARMLQASPDSGNYFLTVLDEEVLASASQDYAAAIEAGAEASPQLLGSYGDLLFRSGDYEGAEEQTRAALDLNDQIPSLWLNLGVQLAAQGRHDESERAYQTTIGLLEARPDPFERQATYESARSDLEILVQLEPEQREFATQMQQELTATETESRLDEPLTDPLPEGAIRNLKMTFEPSFITMTFAAPDLAEGAHLSWIWYFRDDETQPWQQRPQSNLFETFGQTDNSSSDFGEEFYQSLSDPCSDGGMYRLDLYSEGELILQQEAERPASTSDALTDYYDPIGGYSLCHPASWDADERPGALTLAAPDDAGSFVIRSAPIPSEYDRVGKSQLEQVAVHSLAEGLGALTTGSPRPVTYGFEQGRRQQLVGGGWVWAAASREGVLRTIVVDPAADSDVVAEILRSIVFSAAY